MLFGKTAIISGALGHLGSTISVALATAGVHVHPLDLAVGYDVTNRADWERLLARVGNVDILINGANANASTPFLDITEEDWDRILSVQLTGTMIGCQVIGGHMVECGSGSIINISSAASDPPLSTAFAYSAAKAAVTNLSKNLAREWGDKGVRVNVLRPGFFPPAGKVHPLETEIMAHTPMKRYGNPSELCGAVLWLASDESGFVTGAEIPIDGGFSAMSV